MGLNATALQDARRLGEKGAAERRDDGDALSRAEDACRAGGARLTPIRRRVLEMLLATRGSLGAYDLADALAAADGKRLAPITIYRALDFLIAQGLAHRLASCNAFAACRRRHGREDPVALLICDGCGEVEEQASAGLSAALSHVWGRAGFEARLAMIEVAGRCPRCGSEPAAIPVRTAPSLPPEV